MSKLWRFAIEDTQRSLTSPTFQTDFSPLSSINLGTRIPKHRNLRAANGQDE